MSSNRRSIIGTTLRGLLLAGALAAPLSGRTVDEPPGLEERLESLKPERPREYFELAEEVAEAGDDPEARSLARRLFGLAGVLDVKGLGRSACLALGDLADLEENDLERQRLLALASLLPGPGLMVPGARADDGGAEPSDAAVLAVTEAFSYYRRGRGPKAMAALRNDGAMELLEACDRLLPGGTHRFIEDCKAYRQNIRPSLLERDLVRILHLEAALLAGPDRSWSSDLLLREGRPLIEVDPGQVAETLGVDAARPLYRRGRWVAALEEQSAMTTLTTVVMAKRPDAGRVKTRLAGAGGLDGDGAAAAGWAMLVCTVTRLAARHPVVLAVSPGADLAGWPADADRLLLGAIRGSGGRIVEQGTGSLGERLDRVWRLVGPSVPVAFFGGDSPDVPGAALDAIAPALDGADVALGPTTDGGYWTLAAGRRRPEVLVDIDWGGSSVYDQSHRRAREAGAQAATLPEWHDVDRPEDLAALRDRLARREGSPRTHDRHSIDEDALSRLAARLEALGS